MTAQAQSGIGKMATFAISILQQNELDLKPPGLGPSSHSELAQQIQKEVTALGDYMGTPCHASIGGTPTVSTNVCAEGLPSPFPCKRGPKLGRRRGRTCPAGHVTPSHSRCTNQATGERRPASHRACSNKTRALGRPPSTEQ